MTEAGKTLKNAPRLEEKDGDVVRSGNDVVIMAPTVEVELDINKES